MKCGGLKDLDEVTPKRLLLQLAVSFRSFNTTACICWQNKQGFYQKMQMYFLFTNSNYKLECSSTIACCLWSGVLQL